MILASAVLLAGLAAPGEALFRPIRTNEPGTGVFIGSGMLGQLVLNRESNGEGELTEAATLFDLRYAPATHWVFGLQVPYVFRRMDHARGSESARGLGDLVVTAKHRFFRGVGRWSDRHAAVEVGLKLPTGSSGREVDASLPIATQRRVQPGSGSTDFFVDLIYYQEGRRRFVYGGNLSYRLDTEGEGYAFGDQMRLNLDLEYILFPPVYTRPGKEVFVLLETSVIHREADEHEGRRIAHTRRTEVLLAPGIQYIATEQMLVSFSLQIPAHTRVRAPGFRRDLNVLAEVRYAF